MYCIVGNQNAFRAERDVYDSTGSFVIFGDIVIYVYREKLAEVQRKHATFDSYWGFKTGTVPVQIALDDVASKIDFPERGDISFFVSVRALEAHRDAIFFIQTREQRTYFPPIRHEPLKGVSSYAVLHNPVFDVDVMDATVISRPYPEDVIVKFETPIRALRFACMHHGRVIQERINKTGHKPYNFALIQQRCTLLSATSARRCVSGDIFPRQQFFGSVQAHADITDADVDTYMTLCGKKCKT